MRISGTIAFDQDPRGGGKQAHSNICFGYTAMP